MRPELAARAEQTLLFGHDPSQGDAAPSPRVSAGPNSRKSCRTPLAAKRVRSEFWRRVFDQYSIPRTQVKNRQSLLGLPAVIVIAYFLLRGWELSCPLQIANRG